jgi:transcriptional regulator with XRE-family HTH domain
MCARQEKKLSIAEVMAKSGLSRNTIISLEADELVVVNDLLRYIAAVGIELRFTPPDSMGVIGCSIECKSNV